LISIVFYHRILLGVRHSSAIGRCRISPLVSAVFHHRLVSVLGAHRYSPFTASLHFDILHLLIRQKNLQLKTPPPLVLLINNKMTLRGKKILFV